MTTLRKLDSLLSQLHDGTWHSLTALAEDTKIPRKKLDKVARLLAKPDIIEYQAQKGQIKMREEWRRLFKHTDETKRGRKAAVATIVLHPQGTIRIQGVQITNLLDTDLAVTIRVDRKLEEIALNHVEPD